MADLRTLRKEKDIERKSTGTIRLSSASIERINRRKFLGLTTLFAIGASLPLNSCLPDERPEVAATRDPNILSELEWKILIAVQEVLFPHEENAPGAVDINAAGYFQWVLADPEMDPSEINFKKKGLSRLNEASLEVFSSEFAALNEGEKELCLQNITKESWGRSWISTMLLHIFEALLSDPIYGGNTNEAGWKWLNYIPGIPRPEKGKIYLDYTLSDGTKISGKNG
jgi:gluconate 2-dehydrogenase gamma chain